MKTVFLIDSDKYHTYVYPESVIASLREITDCDGVCYTPDDLRERPGLFADTENVFSTWMMPRLTSDEVAALLPSLKNIFYAAGTVQYFARPYMENGVRVFSAWAANAVPVAEYAVAQIVLANKGFFRSSSFRSLEEHAAADRTFRLYPGNYSVKVGILGAGMIGKKVISLLRPLGIDVLVFDPFLPDETAAELGVEKASLERVFAECQTVSNHLASNEATYGMLGGKLFESMLPHATFLNTGRGAQVVEAEMCAVLKDRPDLTAVLDVTQPEPPQDGSELYSLPNVILTPHMAGSSGNEVHRMAEYMLDEYRRVSAGDAPMWEVTEKMLRTMA